MRSFLAMAIDWVAIVDSHRKESSKAIAQLEHLTLCDLKIIVDVNND